MCTVLGIGLTVKIIIEEQRWDQQLFVGSYVLHLGTVKLNSWIVLNCPVMNVFHEFFPEMCFEWGDKVSHRDRKKLTLNKQHIIECTVIAYATFTGIRNCGYIIIKWWWLLKSSAIDTEESDLLIHLNLYGGCANFGYCWHPWVTGHSSLSGAVTSEMNINNIICQNFKTLVVNHCLHSTIVEV